MRSFRLHIYILAALTVPGIALFAAEALSLKESGWLVQQYAFTRLYWLAFSGYALGSTCIVLSVGLFHKIRKTPLSRTSVILSHAIPVALVWISISLGLHDRIQEVWKKSDLRQPPRMEQTERKRPPIPAAPIQKRPIYESSGNAAEPEKQESR
jgi:hypothetical protein